MKLRLGLFALFALIIFIFIRIYSSYPTSLPQVQPAEAEAEGYQPIALTTQAAVEERLLLFVSADKKIQFEYPEIWTVQTKSLSEIAFTKETSTASPAAVLRISREQLNGRSLSGMMECTETKNCEKVTYGSKEYLHKKQPTEEFGMVASPEAIIIRPVINALSPTQLQQVLETLEVN